MNFDLRFNNRYIWFEENIMFDKIKKIKNKLEIFD